MPCFLSEIFDAFCGTTTMLKATKCLLATASTMLIVVALILQGQVAPLRQWDVAAGGSGATLNSGVKLLRWSESPLPPGPTAAMTAAETVATTAVVVTPNSAAPVVTAPPPVSAAPVPATPPPPAAAPVAMTVFVLFYVCGLTEYFTIFKRKYIIIIFIICSQL